MFANRASPISAFAVYNKKIKQTSKGKSETSQSNGIKRKKKVNEIQPIIPKNLVTIKKNKRKNKLKNDVKLNLIAIQESITSNKSKEIEVKKKKIQKKLDKNTSEDEDVPPTLVPIHIPDTEIVIEEGISELNKTDPTPDGLKVFKWLISPVTPARFFEKYWETDVLHIQHCNKNYYTDILTTHRLDGIFREFPLYYTKNVDVVSYENGVKEIHNEEGKVIASVLYDYYTNGCSIRVLNPHTYDQKVHLLIANLQEYFGAMVGANIYLTPPDSQGFAPHYDDIEAFVIQLEGRKHWKLYKPKNSDVLARYSSPNLKHEDIGEPFMEVTLNAGDLLYFPRGTIHEGRTDPEAHSFHITISVYQRTSYADLLEHALPAALKLAASEEMEFRKGLPLNYLKHVGYVNKGDKSKERKRIMQNVEKLLESLKKYVDVDGAADQLGRKFMYDSMPPILSKQEVNYTSKCDGDYMKDGKIFNRVEIDMDTEIRLLRYHCIRLVIEQDSPKIYYNTENAKYYHGEEEQYLIIDHNLTPCIKALQTNYPKFLKVDDLPVIDGDDAIKAQLVSDLWERGLLVTNGHLGTISDDENSVC
ncbi:ribosomal oxygenase 1 isoform X1 [Diorhabda sublineata]|uniref:ribosomal oxygenase 1 isoform X1 n=1 Tax=Diorhabda sublineata TaxID=1163346 RepID=UPI0024E14F0B|nr:ribosomal oxygenase 1 isoform X1 [Diorhabda sublineata]